MKDLGASKKILGMEITRDKFWLLFLTQHGYINEFIHCFNMSDAKKVTTTIALYFKSSSTQCLFLMKILSTCHKFRILVLLVL
jgi:hypothetical protein